MANFQQAIKWLEEGKKVKRTNWRIDGEVHLILSRKIVRDCYGEKYRFDYDDIVVKNWVVYREGRLNVL